MDFHDVWEGLCELETSLELINIINCIIFNFDRCPSLKRI